MNRPARVMMWLVVILVTGGMICGGRIVSGAGAPQEGNSTRSSGPAGQTLLASADQKTGTPAAEAPQQVSLNGHVFSLPAGFEIQLVAGPPLVDRPITAALDDQGRLYVTDSSGTNDKVDKQLADKPHQMLRLEDKNQDGIFDSRTVFADKLMFPEGTMWLDGSVYVAAPPSIWKLTDTNDDGVADERVEWFKGKTLTGCANDLHGPYHAPDGWIYWCKGAFAEQTYERPGRAPFVTKASHIFRCRPDGSGLEHVMTGGMDNPVDVTFTPGGERIFTTTFFQFPGGGKRDGLIHALYGGLYGKEWGVLDGHPRTGPIMPVLSHLGPAAPCGLTTYLSPVFGKEYQYNLFACCFNLHKITRHVLSPAGGQFQSEDSDFLVSDNVDFHPTDVLEDADGSLLVFDTGGWYKLCCPTSQLWKPDILGGIYRIRRTGTPNIVDPRGESLVWGKLTNEQLGVLLGDDRPVVQERAIRELARRQGAAVSLLGGVIRNSRSPVARRNAVWCLTRIDNPSARAAVREAVRDPADEVSQAALNSISLWRDDGAIPFLLVTLRSGSPIGQRLAAECLGRIGDPQQIVKLLAAINQPLDRAREHALTYALLETGNAKAIASALQQTDQSPQVMRAALLAFEQLPGVPLVPESIAEHLTAKDPGLKDAATWIVGRHPEWGGALAGFLKRRLANSSSLNEVDQSELAKLLSQFAGTSGVGDLLAATVQDATALRSSRLIAIEAIRKSGFKELPVTWYASLSSLIAPEDPELLSRALLALRSFPPAKDPQQWSQSAEKLQLLVANGEVSTESRIDALAVLATTPLELTGEQFQLLMENLGPDKSVATRGVAAEVISKSRLKPDQLLALTEQFQIIGPLEADRLLAPFEAGGDDTVGLKLINSLKDAPVLTSLRPDALKLRLAKFSPAVIEQSQALFAILNKDAEQQKQRLEQALANLKDGDIRRGQAVFMSQKAACSACHAMGYLGGNVGPDLTRIGGVRTERDLLESILFPNASFVRSYEPVVVATQDGKVHNGLIRQETTEELVLGTGPKEEVRINRKDIEEMRPSLVSVMPSGLDQQLTPQQLADLIAFLRNAK